MNYEKPCITVQTFSTQAFLAEDLSATGDNDNPFVDDTNLGDIGHEILDNIFNLNP